MVSNAFHFINSVITRANFPLSNENLKKTWSSVSEDLGVPESLLSDDDFK